MKQQTLKQALYLAASGKSQSLRRAAGALEGLPDGAWPETRQGMSWIHDELPPRTERAYTVAEFVAAAYEVDPITERYRGRPDSDLLAYTPVGLA